MNCKKQILFIAFCCFFVITIYSKSTFGSTSEWGHTNDVSLILTGKNYDDTNVRMKALGYLLYLTVDATKAQRKDGGQINNALEYLKKHKDKFKIVKCPNIDYFCTPGGPSHGYYTHLGWNHEYPVQNGIDYNKTWIERKTFFINTLKKNFKLEPKIQADSFAAFLYYIHILGDHEWDEESTNVTRIPINKLEKEDGFSYEQAVGWRAEKTIVEELLDILPKIFIKQQNSLEYKIVLNSLQRMETNSTSTQSERAKVLLNTLKDYVPQMIEKEGFAKKFLHP